MRHVALMFALLAPALAQGPPGDAVAQIRGDKVAREGAVRRARGHVEARVGGLLIVGEAGTWNEETGDVEVAGRAKATLPGRADGILIRHPAGGLVTREPVVITADRISVRAGRLLRGRGGVVATTRDDRLDAGEIDVFLEIGDGEVRGDVRLNGEVPERPDRRRFRRFPVFPPDIWK